MVSKRAQDDLSDNDELESSPGTKRSRYDDDGDSSENGATSTPESPVAKPAKKKAARRDEESDDSDDDAPKKKKGGKDNKEETEVDKENREAAEYEERLREKLLEDIRKDNDGKPKKGKPGTFGIITRIELTNFMCHKRFTLKLGDQINFITGHNGSGKSAVLTALTVALGVKASATGRGSGVKNFIKEGENAAEIEITVKNAGQEAFKPDEYGPTITIVRRFTKEGSGSYKLKSHQGKVISTKKEELTAMCDQMQLQLDNPMNVLSQDNARQFLSGTHAREKYALFLKGTGLQQLSEMYNEVRENIQKTNRTMDNKRESLGELRKKTDEAQAKVEVAQRTEGDRTRLEGLEREKAWALVDEKQKSFEAALKNVASRQRDLEKIEAKLKEDMEKFDAATQELNAMESNEQDQTEYNRLSAEKDALGKEMTAAKSIISSAKTDLITTDQEIKRLQREIDECQRHIDEELAKTQPDRAELENKQAQIAQQIKEKEEEIRRVEDELHTAVTSRNGSGALKEQLRREAEELHQKKDTLNRAIYDLKEGITQAEHAAKNELNRFGRRIPEILKAIDGTSWTGAKPIGPLGRYVKLRPNCGGYADIMKTQIGRTMFAFVVENGRDREQLLRILKAHGNGDANIIIGERDVFDFTGSQPPDDIATIYRVLDISDPWAVRVLVNQHSIEKAILARTRLEAANTLARLFDSHREFIASRGGTNAYSADGFSLRKYPEGGISSSPAEAIRNNRDPRTLLFQSSGAQDINQRKADLAKAEKEVVQVMAEGKEKQTAYDQEKRKLDRFIQDENRLRNKLTKLKSDLEDLNELLQSQVQPDEPINIAVHQERKNQLMAEKDNIVQQVSPIATRQVEAVEETLRLAPLIKELAERLKAIEKEKEALANQMQELAINRNRAQTAVRHWEVKQAAAKDKVDAAKVEEGRAERELTEWTAKAMNCYEKFDRPRKTQTIENEINKLKQQIAASDRLRGYTYDEARAEFQQAHAALEKAQLDIKGLSSFVVSLRNSLKMRLDKWEYFRAATSIRTKEIFQHLLAKRGYSGTLDLRHGSNELLLTVSTDDQAGAQGKGNDKDPRVLSGGEKSFSTVCLLLALWRSLDCPVRCLDEFDVFMDNVNRRVSMNMMIDEAKSANEKQHILLSPLDISHVEMHSCIRVNRLKDPDRGQGILGTGAGHQV